MEGIYLLVVQVAKKKGKKKKHFFPARFMCNLGSLSKESS